MLTIKSNGSKWYGEPPDTVDDLIALLGREPLDPTFEEYGNFYFRPTKDSPEAMVWGNFLGVAHVFEITGTPAELAPVRKAIRANQKRPDYLAARGDRAERIQASTIPAVTRAR